MTTMTDTLLFTFLTVTAFSRVVSWVLIFPKRSCVHHHCVARLMVYIYKVNETDCAVKNVLCLLSGDKINGRDSKVNGTDCGVKNQLLLYGLDPSQSLREMT